MGSQQEEGTVCGADPFSLRAVVALLWADISKQGQ